MENINLTLTTTNDDGTESVETVNAVVINTPEELAALFASWRWHNMNRKHTVEMTGAGVKVPYYLAQNPRQDFTTDKSAAKRMTEQQAQDMVERAALLGATTSMKVVTL